MPVLFILLLPIAFAASVKQDDKADNVFTFTYDATDDELVSAASSKYFKMDDDVDFTVSVTDQGASPLMGRVRFGLLADEGVRYTGEIHYKILDGSGDPVFEEDRAVSFTLRPRAGKKTQTVRFPFDLATSGDYSVKVTFSR